MATTTKPKKKKKKQQLKDPRGGLTAAGRAHFRRTEGAHLQPGVTGAADTPEKMRRKGSFLVRFFTHPRGPLVDDDGAPTRLALSAHAWGEPVPQTLAAAHALAKKGQRLLARYRAAQQQKKKKKKTPARATKKKKKKKTKTQARSAQPHRARRA